MEEMKRHDGTKHPEVSMILLSQEMAYRTLCNTHFIEELISANPNTIIINVTTVSDYETKEPKQ